ncbi:MAG: aryl-sulfate sulfotransferase [Candidatus Krumholzibacteria bacterium]|nr:aryl-sulfate sulfotransferase [Candidatus Krumholzibacteria bacterium]
MKAYRYLLIAVGVLVFASDAPLAESLNEHFYYVSPAPGAQLVPAATTITLRPRAAERGAPWTSTIEVDGQVTGRHSGDWIIADDSRTFIFRPHEPFALGELVTVSVDMGSTGEINQKPIPFSFDFRTSPRRNDSQQDFITDLVIDPQPREDLSVPGGKKDVPLQRAYGSANDYRLPTDFPQTTVAVSDDPGDGFVFVSNINFGPGSDAVSPYLMILDNTGFPIFFRKMSARSFDFKKQPNGLLTYNHTGTFYAMDNTYTVVDSFKAGNGYLAIDLHDFLLLPNGHALFMIYDAQPVDMSQIVEGGDPEAIVVGLVIQELDQSKNVVFQWRSWDHMEITESTLEGILTRPTVDYVHGNAVDVDLDGHILLSSRHLDEITKINRQTGEIIWRMGGKKNEFTLVNDDTWFSRQHDIRRLPNGNITMYDNGWFQDPPQSRAVEYTVDEVTKTTTLVWEYREPGTFGSAMGSARRLPGGNTLIGWGSTTPAVSEARPDGTKAFEMAFPPGTFSYRAFRFPWQGVAAKPYLWAITESQTLSLHFMKFGDDDVETYNIYRGDSPAPTTLMGSTPQNSMVIRDFVGGETLYFRVTSVDGQGNESPFSNEISVTPDFTNIAAVIDVHPETLNLKSNGRWITAYIEFSDNSQHSVADIDVSSVRANGSISAAHHPASIGDADDNHVADLMVKFPRDEIQAMLPAGETVEIRVSGSMGVASFDGVDFIRVIGPGGSTVSRQPGEIPAPIVLHQNLPNPFNPVTTIRFELPHTANVRLTIYTVEGKLVRNLVRRELSPGTHGISWDGKDARGNAASSGVYVYRLEAGDKAFSKKMVLLK